MEKDIIIGYLKSVGLESDIFDLNFGFIDDVLYYFG